MFLLYIDRVDGWLAAVVLLYSVSVRYVSVVLMARSCCAALLLAKKEPTSCKHMIHVLDSTGRQQNGMSSVRLNGIMLKAT